MDWDEVEAAALAAARTASSRDELEAVRVRLLGRKGEVTAWLRAVGSLPAAERPAAGQRLNALRQALDAELQGRLAALERQALAARLAGEAVDVTLPGRRPAIGHPHPLALVQGEIERTFAAMGFVVAEGPEVETDWFNFEALNIPASHPAREMHDSFYLGGAPGEAGTAAGGPAGTPSGGAGGDAVATTLLRTHTSPVQVRYMRGHAPDLPVRIIAAGRVYRRDDDATHSPMFHQVEGLLVDRGVSFAHLKGVLAAFAERLFGPGTQVRLRPSYFPFTEPSAEADVSCSLCGGGGCRTCKGSGWLEVLGAGMVHPEVLRSGGYDPEEVSGFAFGMGIERIAMLRYGIDDLRHFFQNDLRFLEQF